MRNRIIVHLLPNERAALQQMAERDFRPPNEQIRLLIINEATKLGILPTKINTGAKVSEANAGVVKIAR